MWKGSEYYASMHEDDRKQYEKKLTLSDETILPDPYILENWSNNVALMPDLTWGDMYQYLINTPNEFSHEAMKAYRSLEAYNFYVSGHVQDVFYHAIDNNCDYCIIKSEVLPSQRQGQKQQCYEVWAAVNNSGGWIFTVNCKCMAGLGSVCSHVAALLFRLQACTQLGLNKVACTSTLCSWKKSRRQAIPAPLIASTILWLVHVNSKRGKC
ncbi:uncharacterized protein LOC130648104 [Hydractinia symbiolongicarpus]|uniref:uncharacterized protein LOC130648104 n=1 Tax=Hydractinia symbiolongicarpus TaxID=13093 RepID=UPI00254EB6CC|nr:uncharacterized protein LOC130648104 [Hydractinia symbiolongicarpus]